MDMSTWLEWIKPRFYKNYDICSVVDRKIINENIGYPWIENYNLKWKIVIEVDISYKNEKKIKK